MLGSQQLGIRHTIADDISDDGHALTAIADNRHRR